MDNMKLNERMIQLGQVRSVIRETFEYGNRRAEEIGRENVFDFSLGNPSVPAPKEVNETIDKLVREKDPVALHGYSSAQGAPFARQAIADDLNRRFAVGAGKDDLYLTCGAAASLTITLNAIVNPDAGDEVIAVAPFFPEYRVFTEAAHAKLVIVPADEEKFEINFAALKSSLTSRTKAIIINTPNNPTGAVLSDSAIQKLCGMLEESEKEFGHPIFLISDEPYRELVFDRATDLPYFTNLYENTIVCYSFSKSLSVPGERFGYIFVNPRMKLHDLVYAAVCGAGRALGYVCAPSLMQNMIPAALGRTSDLSVYKENRDILYKALCEFGFTCVHPDGAFYLFVKSPEPDASAFCERARKYEVLFVASDSFGCPGYVRIAYCVSTDMIKRSLPAFKALAEEYGL